MAPDRPHASDDHPGRADDPDATGELPSVVLPPPGERISLVDELTQRDGVFDRHPRRQPASRLPEPDALDALRPPVAASAPHDAPPSGPVSSTLQATVATDDALDEPPPAGVGRLPLPLRRLLRTILSMPAPDGSRVRVRLWQRGAR